MEVNNVEGSRSVVYQRGNDALLQAAATNAPTMSSGAEARSERAAYHPL